MMDKIFKKIDLVFFIIISILIVASIYCGIYKETEGAVVLAFCICNDMWLLKNIFKIKDS